MGLPIAGHSSNNKVQFIEMISKIPFLLSYSGKGFYIPIQHTPHMRLLAFAILLFPSLLHSQCVFISEYIEGAGNDKCIEIYNGTGAPLDLAAGGYELQIYSNGSPTVSGTIALTGVIAAGDVHVICNTAAAMSGSADQLSGAVNFNGNDAVALANAGGILDVVGQIGVNPGTQWAGTTCTSGTQNGRLIRKPSFPCPANDGTTAFDPDTEWDCDLTTDDSDLGTHVVAGCGLNNLVVTANCNAGVGEANLSVSTFGAVSTQFTLTVTPDPGGLSGTYLYTALPLSLTGFTGDSLTGYDFTVSDVGGSCIDDSETDVRFDCPTADQLEFPVLGSGCIDTNDIFTLTVCATENSSGKTQTDFSSPITIAVAAGATGTLTGTLTQTPVNGCATFNLIYDTDETITFEATAVGLPLATSGSLTISEDCAGVVMKSGLINPCGNDSQNEFIAATTNSASTSVADIEIYSINQSSGVQPNVNYTWSASGTSIGGSTTQTCGTGLNCNRWLDINTPADATTINNLVALLNAQAGCVLFVAPTGPNFGTIPPNSSVIFFMGAGGNGGTIAPGFDGLGTNLKFDSYCSSAPIYVVFGEHNNPSVTLGFFANSASRTYQINTVGVQSSSVTYPNPTLEVEPEIVDNFSNYTTADSCTPPSLFGPTLLEAEYTESYSELLKPNSLVLFPNPATESITATLPFSGPKTIRQKVYSIDGKSTNIRIFELAEGKNQLKIELTDFPPAMYLLEIMTDTGAYRTTFIKH